MKLRSVVWVALVAIALAGTSIVGLANPMTALPGFDDVPYFSDINGVPKTHFALGEKVYVAYFESATTCFNDHVSAPDEMGVAVDSQSTEGCPGVLNSGTVVDGADVDPVPCGPVGGNSGPNEVPADTLAGGGGSPNVAYLALQEITPGLPYDGIGGPNGANNSGFFIGDVATTPVTVLAGDHLVVGLAANNQGNAYIQATLSGVGTSFIWYDSVSNVDPGTRGYGAGGTVPAAPGPGDGLYGPGDEMVWEITIHGFCGVGAPPFWYYRVNGGAWNAIAPVVVATAWPTHRLGYTPPIAGPGSVTYGDLVEYLYDPTGTATVGATPIFGDTIVDQPVDVASAAFTTVPPTIPPVPPFDGCTGYIGEYMTITTGVANSVVNGWVGVYDAPVAYDARFEPGWPVVINVNGLTLLSGSPTLIDASAGIGNNVENMFTITGNNVTFGTPGHGFDIIAPAGAGTAANNVKVLSLQGTPVTVEANTIRGLPYCAIEVFRGAPNPKQITVKDNELTTTLTSGGNNDGVGLYSDGGFAYQSLVSGNTIHGFLVGINVQNLYDNAATWAAPSATFVDNTIYDTYANGLSISAKDGDPVYPTPVGWDKSQYVVIRENTFYQVGGNAVSIGEDATGDTSDVRVWFNDIYDSGTTTGHGAFGGVHVRANVDATTISVEYNSFVDNTYAPPGSVGVLNDGTGLLTCELNWWGSTTGPAHNLNANGIGDGAGPAGAGVVDYRPWLNGQPVCGAGSDGTQNTNTAFQGNKTVEANSWYWTINQALAATHAMGCIGTYCRSVTIDVGPGTYAEEINFGYTNIGSTTIRSTGGKAVTNIEAGADVVIINVGNAPQHLQLGDGGSPRGFTIYFDAAAVPGPTANKIVFLGSSFNIFDCDVLGTAGVGIHVNSASAQGSIVNTLVDDCDTAGIWLQNVNAAGFTVDNCTITNGGDGILIDSGANTITNCLIQFNTLDGIVLNSNGNTVGGSGNTIRNNAQNGLRIVAQGTTVSGNTIHNNGDRGIDITGNNNTFDNNLVTSNAAQGVILRGTSTGNVFNTDESAANTNCIYDNDSDGSNNHEQMRNLNTATTVDATHNFWGSDKGPFNAMNNPSGDMNSRITDFIDATPFSLTCGGGTADATKSLACGAGWYLTSVPLVPGDPVAENVYSSLPVFAAYQYNPNTAVYDDLTGQNISWEDGYWLWLMGNETITVVGGEVTTDQVILLGNAGWQQFSVPSVDIPVTGPDEGGRADPDIQFRVPGGPWYTYNDAIANGLILPGIFYYDTCAGAYDPAMGANAVLDPWNGYWIETLLNGVEMQIPVAYWIANPWVAPSSFRPMRVDTDGRTPPAPPAIPASLLYALDQETGIVVSNEPNPIRDVHTTTFSVKAAVPIEAILVQIFDLNGTLVFSESQPGDELVWHTDNDYGEYLANGVYLYRVSVLIDGRWIVTEVRKLAIFR